MGCSAVLVAKRALVALLHALAPLYNVQYSCTRDSSDDDIVKVFRKLVLKTHPDRGGDVRHQQQLNEARASWERAKKKLVMALLAAEVRSILCQWFQLLRSAMSIGYEAHQSFLLTMGLLIRPNGLP